MLLLSAASQGEAVSLLCTLLLIVAVILTVLLLLSLLGLGFGPFRRTANGGYGYLGGPIAGAVIAWVLYVLLC